MDSQNQQTSLFSLDQESEKVSNLDLAPLAAQMRPQSLADYVGQEHILGSNSPLRAAIEQGHCHSLIFWGPPGTGKTTLAEIIAIHAKAKVVRLSAVTSGIKDIRLAIEKAKELTGETGVEIHYGQLLASPTKDGTNLAINVGMKGGE